VVTLLVRGRSGELDHPDVAGIDVRNEALDCTSLSGRVPAFEQHAYRRPQPLIAELAAERQPQLG
jgi:hypothetical protein